MSCQNCYNGCTEIIPDKCTKYTGNNIPELGIENGDSLFSVEQSIFSFLISVIGGTSIKPEINEEYICGKISQYLGEQELTLPNIINVILQTACDLQTQITTIGNELEGINTEYILNCISGVTNNANTHEVLQAVITKLCSVNTALSALSLNVNTNYVKLSELNQLIGEYLSGEGSSSKMYNKMVPYTAVEYYGSIAGKFDSTGAGLGEWEKIYLCNGNNGTPDKRGRVAVGATSGMGGGTLSNVVDPAIAGNPDYSLGSTHGNCVVKLDVTQIPSHTHTATVTVNDPGHSHSLFFERYPTRINSNPGYSGGNSNYSQDVNKSTTTSTTGITVNVSNSSIGGGLGHNNVQPSIGCYYIMYIPS